MPQGKFIDPLQTLDHVEFKSHIEPICRNCKFWEKYDSEFGRCDNADVKEYWSYNESQRPMFPPDFGCIHFEAKDV